jgi:hypothetical protein
LGVEGIVLSSILAYLTFSMLPLIWLLPGIFRKIALRTSSETAGGPSDAKTVDPVSPFGDQTDTYGT